MTIGYFGKGAYGKSPYGGPLGALRVVSASAPNPYTVIVTFDQPIDVTFAPFLDPTNYTIPGLGVSAAAFASPTSVQLTTSQQIYTLYTVTVGVGRSATNRALDILYRTATFTGYGTNPSFFALGLTRRRVRLVFSTTMRANADLLNPASYSLAGVDGSVRTIEEVQLEQQTDVLSLVLVLGPPPSGGDPDLEDDKWYQVTVSPLVVTTTLLSLVPNTSLFQWVETAPSLSIDLGQFTGEVQGGLFGNPLGLVFFSPALEVPAANSIIQIDQVDVCTTAYDTYTFPTPIDPFPLYTWSPTTPLTGLGQTGVSLWAAFPRLVDARFEITFTGPSMVEPMPVGIDGPATATFNQQWALAFIALLNNSYWGLGPTPAPASALFICANNLGPIPPGPLTTVVLEKPPVLLNAALLADSALAASLVKMNAILFANSSLAPSMGVAYAVAAGGTADSDLVANLSIV